MVTERLLSKFKKEFASADEEDLLRILLQRLPRCTRHARLGLEKRCKKIGLFIIEQNEERDYGSDLCLEHALELEGTSGNDGRGKITVRIRRYTPPLLALAARHGIKLEVDDPSALGILLPAEGV